MNREFSRALLVLASLLFGCGEEYVDPTADDHPALPLLADGPLSAPVSETSVLLPTDSVTVRVEANFGEGCVGRMSTREFERGFIDIWFTTFLIRFPASPSSTLPQFDRKRCLVYLKIGGAPGFRYVVNQVDFQGSVKINTPGVIATFTASLWWEFGEAAKSETPAKIIEGVIDDTWAQPFTWVGPNNQSPCSTGQRGEQALRIDTSLALMNPDPRKPAFVALETGSGKASIVLDVDAQKCSPGT